MKLNFHQILADLANKQAIDYVQIGAMDGKSYDPMWPFLQDFSHAIERADVFEPNPIQFKRLSDNLERFPQIRCHNLAIGSPDCDSEQTLYYVHPDDIAKHGLPRWAEGISSFYLDKNALGGIGPQQTPEIHSLIKPYIRDFKVKTLPLRSAFDSLGIKGCDVLLTDTEGHDWEIIKQWDCQSFGKPAVNYYVVILLSEPDKREILSRFDQNEYDYEVQGQNVIAKLR
jgi:hypothetical protein